MFFAFSGAGGSPTGGVRQLHEGVGDNVVRAADASAFLGANSPGTPLSHSRLLLPALPLLRHHHRQPCPQEQRENHKHRCIGLGAFRMRAVHYNRSREQDGRAKGNGEASVQTVLKWPAAGLVDTVLS